MKAVFFVTCTLLFSITCIPNSFAHEPNFGTSPKTSNDILELCKYFYEEYQLIGPENFKDHHKLFLHAKICPILFENIAWSSKHPQKDIVLIFEIEKKLDENSNYLKDKHLNEKSIPKWFERKVNLWVMSDIKNGEFLRAVEELEDSNLNEQKEIPRWFKQTTKWYLEEIVSEKEFLNSIKYLIKLHQN